MTVADRVNKFIADVQTDKKVQTLTAGIVFFLIAFPAVFAVMSSGDSEGGAMGGVGTYNVSETITNIPFASGEEEISNGDDFIIDLTTDNIPSGENIVGVIIGLTYSENEAAASGVGPCAGSNNGADTITASATKDENTAEASGQNNGGSGSHEVLVEWYNSSLLSGDIEGLSEGEIDSQLDAGMAGYGDYSFTISVDATTGGTGANPTCNKADDTSETVTWTIELISLEYAINRVISEE